MLHFFIVNDTAAPIDQNTPTPEPSVVPDPTQGQSMGKVAAITFVGALVAFLIPFYPLFVLLTNHNLELEAIIFLSLLVINVPIGFLLSLLVTYLLAKSAHVHLPKKTMFLFLILSVASFGYYAGMVAYGEIQTQKNEKDFVVSASLLHEAIEEKKTEENESEFVYTYTVSLTNSTTQTFDDVDTSENLKAGEYEMVSPNWKTFDTIPVGQKNITGEFLLDRSPYGTQDYAPQSVRFIVELNDRKTGVNRTMELQSSLDWASIQQRIATAKLHNTPPGFRRYIGKGRGYQFDYPDDWSSGYSFLNGMTQDTSNDLDFTGIGKGAIFLSWDPQPHLDPLCINGGDEVDIHTLMAGHDAFLKNYATFVQKGGLMRVCVMNPTGESLIVRTLDTFQILP